MIRFEKFKKPQMDADRRRHFLRSCLEDKRSIAGQVGQLSAYVSLRLILIQMFLVSLLSAICLLVGVARVLPQQKPPENSENIAKGKEVYMKRCSFCHGLEGKGDGPVADTLSPRPRDFIAGLYKFRTTESGEVPRDEDLFRTLTKGLPGTAMESFAAIPEKERWQVIYYIKQFAPDYFDPKEPPLVAKIGSSPPFSEEMIDKGKGVYQKAKCWQCHGQGGRGDGPSAGKLEDEWGNPILPADLTKGWQYRGGKTVEEIYRTFTTGINGTPMPSYTDTIPENERWALAYYVNSIARPSSAADVVIRAKEIKEKIPLDPNAKLWEEVPSLDVPLSGQVVVAPRWQNHAIDLIRIRSVYNDKEVGFLLEWNDRFKNVKHLAPGKPAEQSKEGSYPKVDAQMIGKWSYRDAVALQFPVQVPDGPDRPYFYRGEPGKPVNIWKWNADWQEAKKGLSVQEQNGAGYKAEVKSQPEESQEVKGKGIFKDGQWKVIVVRSLTTSDSAHDIQFVRGKLIPVALHAWDGANGEVGRKSSISSWVYLLMEPPTSWWAYLYVLMGVVVAAVGERWLVERVRK